MKKTSTSRKKNTISKINLKYIEKESPYYGSLRAAILLKLKNNIPLKQEEIETIIKYDPVFANTYIKKDLMYAKAWVKYKGYVNSKMFPRSLYNDRELIYHIISYCDHFPSEAIGMIDEDMLFQFAKEHDDYELRKLIKKLNKYFVVSFHFENFYNDKSISLRLKSIEQKSLGKKINRKKDIEKNKSEEINNLELKPKNIKCPTLIKKENIINRKNKIVVKENLKDAVILHYISDLHLDHKIYSKKSSTNIKNRIMRVVNKARKDISDCLKVYSRKKVKQYLLICGDVSFDYDIAKSFYSKLSNSVPDNCTIIATLGNHELWDGDVKDNNRKNYNKIIQKYVELFDKLSNAIFLQNAVFAKTSNGISIISERMLLDTNYEELNKLILSKSTVVIFGSIGFSGNNPKFNAEKGIYRGTIKSLRKDKEMSKKCHDAYEKVVKLNGNRVFVCMTHTPKTDWSTNEYLENCIYVNGHTHNNTYIKDDKVKIYSDNQIGYQKNNYTLKHFIINNKYTIFDNLLDGIHEIHPVEYLEFAESKNLHYSFNRRNKNTKMYLLKKSGFYMFVTKNKSHLCILHGGRIEKLKYNDLDYYFDNMDIYASQLLSSFNGYDKAIKQISAEIKSLGGDGKVHGCIVDIDFCNHVYLNPFDGTITFYYAQDMTSRISYPSLALLLEHNPGKSPIVNQMNRKIQSKNTCDNKYRVIAMGNKNTAGSYSKGSYLYRPSRVVKKVQGLIDNNIIQIWNDSLIKTNNMKNRIENKK